MAGKRSKGAGSVYYSESRGEWVGQYTKSINAKTGNALRGAVYGKSEEEAQEKLTAALYTQQTSGAIKTERMTVKDWLERWLKSDTVHLRKSSLSLYTNIINNHIIPDLGRVSLKKLERIDIQNFINEKQLDGFSPSFINKMYVVFKTALSQAMDDGYILKNPAKGVKTPKQNKKEIEVLTIDQSKILLKAAEQERFYLLFLLELHTGIRIGEIMALQWKDININKHLLTIRRNQVKVESKDGDIVYGLPKTDSSYRTIPLPESIIAEFKKYKARQNKEKMAIADSYSKGDLVFCDEVGCGLTHDRVASILKRILKKAELNYITFHDLRHTHATQLLNAGVNIKTVSERLGHSNITITLQIYCHVMPEQQEDATKKIAALLA